MVFGIWDWGRSCRKVFSKLWFQRVDRPRFYIIESLSQVTTVVQNLQFHYFSQMSDIFFLSPMSVCLGLLVSWAQTGGEPALVTAYHCHCPDTTESHVATAHVQTLLGIFFFLPLITAITALISHNLTLNSSCHVYNFN